jgi:PAS domain S-box-containing protein
VTVLDDSGHVRMWSTAAQEVLGWSHDQVTGHRFDWFIDSAQAPGLLAELLAANHWNGPLPLRHRDGSSVRCELRAVPLADGDGRSFVSVSLTPSDIGGGTAHPQWRDLDALESLFDSSPLGVAILGKDLRHIKVNDALARLDQHPVEQHLGRTVDEVIPGPIGQALAELQRGVLRTGRPVVDVALPGPGGDGFRSVSCSRLEDQHHNVLGVGCTVMDVSERHEVAERREIVHQRLTLLNDVGSRVSDQLEIPLIAERLADTVVPRFCDYAAVAVLESLMADGELPRHAPTHRTPLIQLGAAHRLPHDPVVDLLLRTGQSLRFSEQSVTNLVLRSGVPQILDTPERLREATYPSDPRIRAAMKLGVHSMMMLPLRAGGIVLGMLVVFRAQGRPAFDDDDMAFAMKLASRASTSLDNARLYAREREGALMLQRALLPQHIPEPPGVHIAFRYVPGSSDTEAGGDWFDVAQLAEGRVALVIGDVTGHGLRAAATMGLLRTAVRTLSVLDLPPAQLLQHIDDITIDLAHDPDEALMATCVYAVYDPAVRRCAIATAGHVPPLLIEPAGAGQGRRVRLLDLPPGAPLGVGGVKFESVEFDVAEGSILALYTDGLVEARGQDISTGVDRLCSQMAEPYPSLEAACDTVLSVLKPGAEPDDVALLLAELSGLPSGAQGPGPAPL